MTVNHLYGVKTYGGSSLTMRAENIKMALVKLKYFNRAKNQIDMR